MSTQINIALIGFGNVGQGVLKILSKNQDNISRRLDTSLNVSKILVRSIEKYSDLAPEGVVLVEHIEEITSDPDIHIVVEAIGGEDPAKSYIEQSLNAGKFVVTANKEVVSKHKTHFFELAKASGVDIYFEASVGGGMPIIRSLKVGYSANLIQSIYGILNGTCNYILTKIEEEGMAFEDALKDAQDNGFAEADPAMDISGLDAAYKLVILAAVAFKVDIQLEDVTYQGIEQVSLKDVKYAKEFGYAIRLLATGRYTTAEHMVFKVYPTLVPLTHPLAHVRNEFNALFTTGNAMGEAMIYGKGAGSLPTGSAVVSDIIDIAFDYKLNKAGQDSRNLEMVLHDVELTPVKETSSRFYLRFLVRDEVGVLQRVTQVLDDHSVSILKIHQYEGTEKGSAEVVLMTHHVTDEAIQKVAEKLQSADVILSNPMILPVGLDEFYPKGLLE